MELEHLYLNDGSELPREDIKNEVTRKSCAEKLDNLMVLTFEHLESCESGGRLVEVFETLLKSFKKNVTTAFKSKFVQFVMFYACELDPVNCGERFASTLAEILIIALRTHTC